MPLIFGTTDWSDLGTARPVGQSANPVLQVKSRIQGYPPLWLKTATGARRVVLAGKVMNRVGLQGGGARVLNESERDWALRMLDAIGPNMPASSSGRTVPDVVAEMRTAIGKGHDMVLMEDVPGVDFSDARTAQGANGAEWVKNLYASPELLADIARLIAADLFLGNFDRLGVNAGEMIRTGAPRANMGYGKIDFAVNARNWKIDGNRFRPIDNDAYAPSLSHLPSTTATNEAGDSRPTSSEDIYRWVIQGGNLKNSPARHAVFEQEGVSSVTAMMGPGARDLIIEILCYMMGETDIDARRVELTPFADGLLPEIRNTMQLIVTECKTPGGTEESLNSLLKAERSVAGMNYSAFKVRTRFIKLMLATGNVDTSMEAALEYGRYRDWKDWRERLFGLVVNPIAAYGHLIPNALEKREAPAQAWSGFKNALAFGSTRAALEDAEMLKDEIRTSVAADVPSLRRDVEGRARTMNDKWKFRKIQFMQLSMLLQKEMEELTRALDSISLDFLMSAIGPLVRGTLRESSGVLRGTIQSYEYMIQLLEPSLNNLEAPDQPHVGVPVLKGKLRALETALTRTNTYVTADQRRGRRTPNRV